MSRLGFPQRGVILRQPRGQRQIVEHLLDFPLKDGRQIAHIFCELFGEHPSSIVWLSMIEFEAMDTWTYLVREVR